MATKKSNSTRERAADEIAGFLRSAVAALEAVDTLLRHPNEAVRKATEAAFEEAYLSLLGRHDDDGPIDDRCQATWTLQRGAALITAGRPMASVVEQVRSELVGMYGRAPSDAAVRAALEAAARRPGRPRDAGPRERQEASAGGEGPGARAIHKLFVELGIGTMTSASATRKFIERHGFGRKVLNALAADLKRGPRDE